MESRLVLVHCLIIAAFFLGVKGVPGGKIDQDPNKLEYWLLAQESLIKYVQDSHSSTAYNVIQMIKVTTQVVSGLLIDLDFHAVSTDCLSTGTNCSLLACHSEVWEQSWLHSKKFKVKCEHPLE